MTSLTSFPTPGWMVGSLASTVCYDRRWKAWDPDRGMSWHTTCDAAKRSGGPFNKFICGWSARNQHSDNQKLRDHNDRSSSGAAAPERVIDALVQDPFDMKSGRTAAALCAFNAAIRDRIAQGRPIAGECAALHCMQLAPHHIEWRPPGPVSCVTVHRCLQVPIPMTNCILIFISCTQTTHTAPCHAVPPRNCSGTAPRQP